MRSSYLALVAIITALGCGARSNLPCPGDEGGAQVFCEVEEADREPEPSQCDGAIAEAPSCAGEGLIWTAPDECLDDGGNTDVGDRLEVYCVNGLARFCLSLEACPWRDGVSTSDDQSCSTAGLGGTHMATMINDCVGWEGHALYCCSPDGRVGFSGG